MNPRRVSCTLLTLLAGLTAGEVHADPRSTNVPGGIAIVPITPASSARPEARLGERRVMVVSRAGRWEAVVGIPLDAAPGTHHLDVAVAGERSRRIFAVKPKRYAAQHIRLKDERKVNPSPLDLKRIERETAVIEAAKARWTDTSAVALDLRLPVHGRISSPFGLRRFFNGEPRKPHAGLDIAVPRGTPVKAAGAGRVIATGRFFFNGKTVFIDHGQGLVTMYCHLERIDVEAEDSVSRGQRIGLSGMTGRATGPHLHWSVILNDTLVDPMAFVAGRIPGDKHAKRAPRHPSGQ